MPANLDMPDLPLLIVIATFNERDSLPRLAESLLDQLPFSRLLVIDDNSPDGTGRWCDQLAKNEPRFSVIHRAGKLGLGSATMLGLTKAQEEGYRWVATLDADLSHNPMALRAMWDTYCHAESETTDSVDVVIGSRYVRGGQILGWPWYRRYSSLLVNTFSRWILGLPTRDNTSAFRIYRVDGLRKIDLTAIKSKGYSYLEEILCLLNKQKSSFAEFPITFRDRQTGQSKVDFGELLDSLSQILRLARAT